MSSQHSVIVLPVQVEEYTKGAAQHMPQHHLKSTITLLLTDTHGPSVFPHFGFILMFNYHVLMQHANGVYRPQKESPN